MVKVDDFYHGNKYGGVLLLEPIEIRGNTSSETFMGSLQVHYGE